MQNCHIVKCNGKKEGNGNEKEFSELLPFETLDFWAECVLLFSNVVSRHFAC